MEEKFNKALFVIAFIVMFSFGTIVPSALINDPIVNPELIDWFVMVSTSVLPWVAISIFARITYEKA